MRPDFQGLSKFRRLTRYLAGAFLCVGTAAAEAPPRFDLPVICEMGRVCFIQNHFDSDSGPEFRDYIGGTLGYDGHKGVDIRLPDYTVMRKGVAVIAAAPGTVRAVRNDMPDIHVRQIDPEVIRNREAGNAVVIRHRAGWESQYSHMMRGSLTVKPGQTVEAGQVIGKIGLSGKTEFPHLHFAVRHKGAHLDPFTGLASGENGEPLSLWSEDAAARLGYIPAAVLNAGFAGEAPEADRARHGDYAAAQVSAAHPAIVFWVDVFGIRAGDREEIRLVGPDGLPLARSDKTLEADEAQRFRAIGKRRAAGHWPAGRYHGTYRLLRPDNGELRELAAVTRHLIVE